MNTSHVEQLCVTCGLGKLLAEPQAVSGGLIHRMWRLTTMQGSFAVKQLNPAIMRRPGMQDVYRLSERIAADMVGHGIPAITAVSCQGDTLQIVDDEHYLLYPWVNGEMLPTLPSDTVHAHVIGSILGRMHTLDLSYPEITSLQCEHFHEDDWEMLAFQAVDQELSWAYPVRAALPKLLEWCRWYEEASETLSRSLVVSHRDLDQKNILWCNTTTPYLIDWEAAGLINPTMELATVALSWSGLAVGEMSEETFAAVMDGYAQAGGTVCDPGITAIYGSMGTLLGWLLFNMRRSLGEAVSSGEERDLGAREAKQTLAILRNLAHHAETWAGWIDRWR
jgi:aminoglycoside phosphotransferase (APT) family kinase protein